MKRIKWILIVCICLTSVISFITINNKVNAVSTAVDTNIKKMMENIKQESLDDPTIALSSSPFDYINNIYFDKIVALGNEALPVLEKKIKESNKNGLEEYILALAIEKIAKVEFRDDQDWSNGAAFISRWDTHLENLQNNINSIVSSTDTQEIKNKKLEKLGTPAIPFIIDNIELGHVDLQPALNNLLAGNAKVSINKNTDITKWAVSHKEEFNSLRKLVTSKTKK